MATPFFHGSFSWILFTVFLVFFVPWCWYTGRSLLAIFTYETSFGVIQDATYVPPDPSSSSRQRPLSDVGTYTHQAIFLMKDGQEGRVLTRVRSNPPAFSVGDQVKVYYDKENPSKALIGTFSELWLPSLALGFFTFVFFVLWMGAWIGPPVPLSQQ